MKKYILSVVLLFSAIPFSTHVVAALDDPTADVAYVRNNCTGVNNCVTTISEMIDWIWNTRNPSVTSPLLVDIGPGVFTIGTQVIFEGENSLFPQKICNGGGHVSFRGAGRGKTILEGLGGYAQTDNFPMYGVVIGVKNCENLTFESFTVRANSTISNHGVSWKGGGNSTWHDVEIDALLYGWLDQCDSSGDIGKHEWYSSTIRSSGGYYNVALRSDCGETAFYGGEILATKNQAIGNFSIVGAMAGASTGTVQIYGSLVRAKNETTNAHTNYNSMPDVLGHGGLVARNGGTIHMHGGVISVRVEASGSTSDVYGVKSESGGLIHTPDTAFGLKAGDDAQSPGIAQRIVLVGGSVASPFQWPANSAPPVNLVSINGSDTFVETDCDSTGNCDNPVGAIHPHMMVYDASCTATGPWYDMATNKCRGE